jgi:hypothetical protein
MRYAWVAPEPYSACEMIARSAGRGRLVRVGWAGVASVALACHSSDPPRDAAQREPALDDPATCADHAPTEALAELGSVESTGYLAPDQIKAVFEEHHASFLECYAGGVLRHPGLSGKITLRLSIGEEGAVSELSVAENDVADCEVVRCIRTHVASIEFPHPEGGSVTLQYPIALQQE